MEYSRNGDRCRNYFGEEEEEKRRSGRVERVRMADADLGGWSVLCIARRLTRDYIDCLFDWNNSLVRMVRVWCGLGGGLVKEFWWCVWVLFVFGGGVLMVGRLGSFGSW